MEEQLQKMMQMMENLQRDVNQGSSEVKTDISALNDNLNAKFDEVKKEVKEMREKVANQEERILAVENHNRKRNLIIFNVKEVESDSADLEQFLLTFFKNQMHIEVSLEEIDVIYRLGKKNAKNDLSRPRPILIGFTTYRKKVLILSNKSKLSSCKIGISDDFSKDILEKRKILKLKVEALKMKNVNARIKYDSIMVDEEKLSDRDIDKIDTSEAEKKRKRLRSNEDDIPIKPTQSFITNEAKKQKTPNSSPMPHKKEFTYSRSSTHDQTLEKFLITTPKTNPT